MRELEKDGLLVRGEPQRGKVGQPSIPMSLNPDGAYFLGLKIGRRSAELVLIDFLGKVRGMRQLSYATQRRRNGRVRQRGDRDLRAGLTAEQDKRIAGLGIAMPFELWNWADTAGAPREALEAGVRAIFAPTCKMRSTSLFTCRTTLRPPAGRNWCSARSAHRATSSISTLARLPAVASC